MPCYVCIVMKSKNIADKQTQATYSLSSIKSDATVHVDFVVTMIIMVRNIQLQCELILSLFLSVLCGSCTENYA